MYIRQVVQVVTSFSEETICLPSTNAEWAAVFAGFEQLSGFPMVTGAIDGTLIRIKRLKDFEGFYCRKGFPAFNVLAVVNHKKQFIAYSIRNGAQNDQSVLNRSHFGQTIAENLPQGAHYLGDAGYKLTRQILTPYPIEFGMSLQRSRYNYVHSHTRIVVEQAFGRLKGILRMYKQPLLQHSPEYMARIIIATLVFHNWMIEHNDKTHEEQPVTHVEDEFTLGHDDPDGLAYRDAISHELYPNYLTR
ncbi:unnamed protein product [Phytophthora fragariaefolia]|uniref:Unnamed protein product n=1 Tax=Phytophthora fragariaefolia TaxID=1490495 RepID=A0A9W6TTP2_9STRA|nr:unnamed protein product [Phytophthora fragariaefolia]